MFGENVLLMREQTDAAVFILKARHHALEEFLLIFFRELPNVAITLQKIPAYIHVEFNSL